MIFLLLLKKRICRLCILMTQQYTLMDRQSKILNEELQIVSHWVINNKLVLNISKTKILILGTYALKSKSQLNLILSNIAVEQVEEIKLLGVFRDRAPIGSLPGGHWFTIKILGQFWMFVWARKKRSESLKQHEFLTLLFYPAPALSTIQLEHRLFDFISIVYSFVAQQGVTWGVPVGPSAGKGWLPGGGVGKLQEGSACLPLHRSAVVCQDEENGSRVSPLKCFFSSRIKVL